MGAEVVELRLVGFPIGRSKWKRDLRVTNIERVEKTFMMDERSVIDIERDFANHGQRVFAVFVIEDAYILCDEAAERIQCQSANGGFDAAPVQFLDHAVSPLPAEPSFRKIPAAAENTRNCDEHR